MNNLNIFNIKLKISISDLFSKIKSGWLIIFFTTILAMIGTNFISENKIYDARIKIKINNYGINIQQLIESALEKSQKDEIFVTDFLKNCQNNQHNSMLGETVSSGLIWNSKYIERGELFLKITGTNEVFLQSCLRNGFKNFQENFNIVVDLKIKEITNVYDSNLKLLKCINNAYCKNQNFNEFDRAEAYKYLTSMLLDNYRLRDLLSMLTVEIFEDVHLEERDQKLLKKISIIVGGFIGFIFGIILIILKYLYSNN